MPARSFPPVPRHGVQFPVFLNDLRAREDISQGVAKVTCQILAGFDAFLCILAASVCKGLEEQNRQSSRSEPKPDVTAAVMIALHEKDLPHRCRKAGGLTK
jgi:hypothetical protein